MKTYSCPVCDADLALDDDDGPGSTIFCSYCNSTIKIYRIPASDDLKLVDDN